MSKLKGLGINVYINHFDSKSVGKLIDSLRLLNIRWVRLEICSEKFINKKKLRILKQFVQKCHALDITVVGLLSDFIPLSIQSVFFPQKQFVSVNDRLDEYLRFLDNVLKHTSEWITHWEVWNEQNTKRFWIHPPSPYEYTQFLKKVSEHIRASQKKAIIVFGGIFGNDVDPIYPFIPDSIVYKKGFLKESLKHGADTYADYFAFHPYTRKCYFSLASPHSVARSIIESIKKTRKKYRSIPLIITEIGVSPILNLRSKARGIAQVYKDVIQYCASIDMPVCIYALSDQSEGHYGSLNPDRDFGFFDYHLKPKKLLEEYLKL